jgi:hypothetical protein
MALNSPSLLVSAERGDTVGHGFRVMLGNKHSQAAQMTLGPTD